MAAIEKQSANASTQTEPIENIENSCCRKSCECEVNNRLVDTLLNSVVELGKELINRREKQLCERECNDCCKTCDKSTQCC